MFKKIALHSLSDPFTQYDADKFDSILQEFDKEKKHSTGSSSGCLKYVLKNFDIKLCNREKKRLNKDNTCLNEKLPQFFQLPVVLETPVVISLNGETYNNYEKIYQYLVGIRSHEKVALLIGIPEGSDQKSHYIGMKTCEESGEVKVIDNDGSQKVKAFSNKDDRYIYWIMAIIGKVWIGSGQPETIVLKEFPVSSN